MPAGNSHFPPLVPAFTLLSHYATLLWICGSFLSDAFLLLTFCLEIEFKLYLLIMICLICMFIDSAPLFPITDSFSTHFVAGEFRQGKKALYLLLPLIVHCTDNCESGAPSSQRRRENILSLSPTWTRFVHSLTVILFPSSLQLQQGRYRMRGEREFCLQNYHQETIKIDQKFPDSGFVLSPASLSMCVYMFALTVRSQSAFAM